MNTRHHLIRGVFRCWAAPTTMRTLLKYCLILSLIALSEMRQGCAHREKSAPRVGDTLDCHPSHDMMFAISASQFVKGCRVTRSGVNFLEGSIDGKTVDFVSTQDSTFTTSEGVHVGSSFREVVLAGGTQIQEEPSWAYFSRLPSGWSARYGGVPGIDIHGIDSMKCDSIVHELFLRGY